MHTLGQQGRISPRRQEGGAGGPPYRTSGHRPNEGSSSQPCVVAQDGWKHRRPVTKLSWSFPDRAKRKKTTEENKKENEKLMREGDTHDSGQSKFNRIPSGTSTVDLRQGSQAPIGKKLVPRLKDTATTSVGVPRPREILLRCFQALEAPAFTKLTQLRGKTPATTID